MTQNNQEQNRMKEKNSLKTGLKKLVGVLMASGVMSMAAVANVQAQDKAAFVYIGPTSDHGWTYSHDQGRIKAEKPSQENIKPLISKMSLKQQMPNV